MLNEPKDTMEQTIKEVREDLTAEMRKLLTVIQTEKLGRFLQ